MNDPAQQDGPATHGLDDERALADQRDEEDRRQWRSRTSRLARAWRAARQRAFRLLSPPAGVLRQHAPRPLVVPQRYAAAALPRQPPAIGLVIPCRNAADTLPATLRSVAGQRYPALDLRVQDGASEDGTLALLEDSGVPWESRPDTGQAQALNRGFARCSGDILGWLNADDVLLPGALACVAAHFADHPEVDVVYGHRILIDSTGREIGRWVMPPHDSEALRWGDYVPQETLFWRRNVWERVGARLDETLDFALDWELLVRFVEAGVRFALLPRFLGCFRVHERQKTSSLMATRGRVEADRIRRRVHGRSVPSDEVARQLEPYLNRSSVRHWLHRMGWLRL